MAEAKNPYDLFLDDVRTVVREEIAAAQEKKKPPKLLYATKEAAELLNVAQSWLASKARAGEIPYRMMGHYRYFSMSDIEAIIERAAVKNGNGARDIVETYP